MEYIAHENCDIEYKGKNAQGQDMRLIMQFECFENSIHWNVLFWIGKKHLGYQPLVQTGKDGLHSLAWAKKCILDFIDNVPKAKGAKHYVVVRWDDSKRRDVYTWALSRLGFRITRIVGKLCLCKRIL